MDASSLTVENIGAMAGVFIVAAWLAAAKYLKERKAPPPATSHDVFLPGVGIADMRPAREGAAALEKIAGTNERIAAALERQANASEAIRDLRLERAADEEKEEEIVRRAEIMAQQMLQQLRPKNPTRTRRRQPP
jgi:hypothetical protein